MNKLRGFFVISKFFPNKNPFLFLNKIPFPILLNSCFSLPISLVKMKSRIHFGSLEEEPIEENKPEIIEIPQIQSPHTIKKPKIIKKAPIQLDRSLVQSSQSLLEEFFYPGPTELDSFRRELVGWTLERAKNRLEQENSFKSSIKGVQLKAERVARYQALSSLQLVGTQVGGERPISSCKFIPDSQELLLGDWNGSCRVLNCLDLEITNEIGQIHSDKISSVNAFSSNLLATSSFDGSICILNNNSNDRKLIEQAHEGRVCKVEFHPNGKLLGTAGNDGNIGLFDLERLQFIYKQPSHRMSAFCLSFHPDGSLLATGGLEGVGRVWDLRTGHCIMTLNGHSKGILSTDWSANGYSLVTCGEDCQMLLWDLRKATKAGQLLSHTNSIIQCKWDPMDSSSILSASLDGTVRVHGAFDLLQKSVYQVGTRVSAMDVSYNEGVTKIVAVSHDKTVKMWSN